MDNHFTHLVCLGDSLTACGKFFDAPPLGNGYVRLLHQRLEQEDPPVAVTNFGFDGFTAGRLLDAIRQTGVSALTGKAPAVFTVLVGINDIGLMMNTGRSEEQKKQILEKFFQTLEDLLTLLRPSAQSILLMEPFVFAHPLEYRLWLPQTRAMSEGIKKIAAEHKLSYLPLQNDLDEFAHREGFDAVTTDGIHLTPTGHRILAQKIIWKLARLGACCPCGSTLFDSH